MPASRRTPLFVLGGLLLLVALVAAGFVGARTLHSSPTAVPHSAGGAEAKGISVKVETIAPTKGGLPRRTSQPGSAHSFESADLYAKVSGFLKTQAVDIGSRVKKGDLLAEIDVPELVEDVEGATASYQQALAEVTQAEARVE